MNVTADALSFALVHSLWQDAVVGLLLWSALVVLRQRVGQREIRRVLCRARADGGASPRHDDRACRSGNRRSPRRHHAIVIAAPVARRRRTAPLRLHSPAAEARSLGWMAALTPWMLPVWLAGVLVCSLRLVLAGMHTVALKRHSVPENGPLAATVATLAARHRRRQTGVRAGVDDDDQPGDARSPGAR